MAIPDYQTFMKPLLEAVADGEVHAMSGLTERLADQFGLTPEERETLLPSGRQSVFSSRVSWARTFLKKAGLLSSPRRAAVQITERGKQVLRDNPPKIDNEFLLQFEEFRRFIEESRRSGRGAAKPSGEEEGTLRFNGTPEEALEAAYSELRSALIADILERIQKLPYRAFERLVVDVLVKIGYGGKNDQAGQVVGKSGDEGIDGIIRQDPLGLDNIYLQAKKWDQPVGRPEVQRFVGALQGQRARKGIFITSSEFTKDARDYTEHLDAKVILIDGARLAELMFEYGIGVSVASRYEVKRIDSDYFAELTGQVE